MKNTNIRVMGSGILLMVLLVSAGCSRNDGEPDTPASVFEMVFATYWGGEPQANKGNAICVDKDGYIYVAGETQCPSFQLKNPVIDKTYSTTGFVSKFTPDGQAVVYSTFLGDPHGYNFCRDIAADSQGNAIAGGMAGGQKFPLKNPLYGTFTEPWQCGFLSSIAPQGSTLNFSTFILQERVDAVALDDKQDIYLATENNIILKISADGSRLLYECKLLAELDDTWITDIAVAGNGALVVAGYSAGWDFPSRNPVQAARGGLNDAFVVKINPQGDTLEFATRLGGSDNDIGTAVALGTDGSIFVCGFTLSADFPLKNAADTVYGGDTDGFAARIDPFNGILLYSTYLGGGGEDWPKAIVANAAGEAYLTGWTTSADFPVRGAIQDHLGGVKDPFVTKLNANGDKILLSTYCGGSLSDYHSETGADWANAICLGPEGKIYVTGETFATDFPLLHPLIDSGGGSKIFIAVLREKQS